MGYARRSVHFWGGVGLSKLRSSQCYGLIDKTLDIQLKSASGGVFTELATYVLDEGGIVFGAAFNDCWEVEHVGISQKQDLSRLRRSKYVQSYNVNSYQEIKKQLRVGRLVLYTGTPCQCLSLRKFLRKEYENLFIVDIVCHGVPSTKVWDIYLNMLCRQNGENKENIKDIQFKYKDGQKYYWKHPGFKVEWKDGKSYIDYSNHTSYENGFLSNLFVRPSCHHCKVKNLTSDSDITIGDFWGCESQCQELFDNNGVSIAIVKTEKGRQLFKRIQNKFNFKEVTIEDVTKYNSRICVSAPENQNRYLFFRELKDDNMDTLVNRLLPEVRHPFLHALKAKIKRLLRK